MVPVSQITPPSSSPTRSDRVQPNPAGPFDYHQNEWPGSSAPPPKRRRKETPVTGEPEVISLLSSDGITQGQTDNLAGQPQHSQPAPHSRPSPVKPRPSATSRSRPRASNPAKALAKAAANGPIDAAIPIEAQPREVACEPPPTSGHDDPQSGWAASSSVSQAPDGQQAWHPPLPGIVAPSPFQPVWNTPAPPVYAQQEDQWMNLSMVDLSPMNPFFQHWYPGGQPFLQPQEQSWSRQPRYAYDMPVQTNTYASYTSPVYQTRVTGTSGRPIMLDDDPVQAVHVPAVTTYAPQTPQSVHSPAGMMGRDKENTYGSELAPHTVPHPRTGVPKAAAQQYTTPTQMGKTQVTQTQATQARAKEPRPSNTKEPKLEPPPDEPNLCPEQAELVSLIEQGHNVFYTGSAGCGKSTVLKAFVRRLRNSGKQVRIIAPTGRAALNVGGSTTWTFAGWTPNSHKLPIDKIKQGAHGKSVYKRLMDTDVLVIDEISMVENLHLERLNILMKTARHNPNLRIQPAFGGCQIVVTGDFCQLPPVKPFQHCLYCGREMTTKVNDIGKLTHVCQLHGEYPDEDKWAFRSNAWGECGFVHFHLKTIHRQNDQKFIRMLQKCRLGHQMKESEISLLMDHKCRVSQATKLYSTRREANDVNRAAFNQLQGVKLVYWCHDSFFWRQCHPHLERKGMPGDWGNESDIASPPATKRPLYALEDHRWAKCVQLKRGMLVVLLTNLDLEAGLCNGSQGVICSFEDYDPEMMPMKEKGNSRGRGKVEPQPGQRVVRGDHASTQEIEIKRFITSESAPVKKWPVVQFHNGLRRTVFAECSIAQLGDEEPYSLLARTQIPLAPAWAMTIHKSQSLTLDRVIVNLSRAFEDGQVYVALSRATGLNGLKIEGDGNFLRSKLMVNSEVAAFLKERFGDIYDATESEDEEAAPG